MLLPFKIDPSVQAERDAVLFNTNFEDFFPEVNTNTSFRSIKSYIIDAIEDYILPHIGEPLYNDLMSKYHSDATMTPSQSRCLKLIQQASAWYTVSYAYANKLDILTDMGNTQLNLEKSMTTPQWAFNKKYGNLLRTADKKLDNLLEYLEKQSDAKVTYFKLWWLDEAYLNGKSDLFHTTKEFQKCHNILSSRRTFVALIPALRDIAKLYIIPHIGIDMYNEIVSQHHESSMTAPNAVLMEYLRAAAAKLAVSTALETQPIFFESDGVRVVSTTEGVEKLQQERVVTMSKSCQAIGIKFLDDLVTFLIKNANQYPTFKNSPLYPTDNPLINMVKISPDNVGAIMF